jgi:predicted Rdx family selenoprotein
VKGHGGVFNVVLGNELFFSKKQLGRFPAPGEVNELLAGKLGA